MVRRSRSRRKSSRSRKGRSKGKKKGKKVAGLYPYHDYTPGGITKLIHQIWIGGSPPPANTLYMSTWMNMPGWKYKLWSNEDVSEANFPITWPYIRDAIEVGKKWGNPLKKYAQVVDLMRLEALYHHGGVYVDTTMESLKNLDDLFDKKSYKFVVSNEDPCGFNCKNARGDKYISNSFIASNPKNKNLARLLETSRLGKIDFFNPRVNFETGPYYLGRTLRKSDGVVMLPTKLIYPHPVGDTQWSRSEPDKCYRWHPTKSFNIALKGRKEEVFLTFPCRGYPGAYMVKHWDVGGSWI